MVPIVPSPSHLLLPFPFAFFALPSFFLSHSRLFSPFDPYTVRDSIFEGPISSSSLVVAAVLRTLFLLLFQTSCVAFRRCPTRIGSRYASRCTLDRLEPLTENVHLFRQRPWACLIPFLNSNVIQQQPRFFKLILPRVDLEATTSTNYNPGTRCSHIEGQAPRRRRALSTFNSTPSTRARLHSQPSSCRRTCVDAVKSEWTYKLVDLCLLPATALRNNFNLRHWPQVRAVRSHRLGTS